MARCKLGNEMRGKGTGKRKKKGGVGYVEGGGGGDVVARMGGMHGVGRREGVAGDGGGGFGRWRKGRNG